MRSGEIGASLRKILYVGSIPLFKTSTAQVIFNSSPVFTFVDVVTIVGFRNNAINYPK